MTYTYACVYDGNHYRSADIGPYGFRLDTSNCEAALSNVIGDVMSGRQGVTDPDTFNHFSRVFEEINPDAVELEQPFMWPTVKRLWRRTGKYKPLLIYSSQNVEAPLKREILVSEGFSSKLCDKVCSEIQQIEGELVGEADLIICVSEEDREYYKHTLNSSSPIIVVRNGVDRPATCSPERTPDALCDFAGRPYLMTVGSGHFPNIEGLRHYVIDDGVFCVPPTPSIAVCGGVARSIADHPDYHRFLAANSARVRLFSDISDSDLSTIKQICHGVFLPIRNGGGTNLKTAEALALGKWVVATSTALRGFESFADSEGVVVADGRSEFRQAMRHVLQRPALQISESSRAAREDLYWDRCFEGSNLPKFFDAM